MEAITNIISLYENDIMDENQAMDHIKKAINKL
jgi:hypothetical protein